jgi:hypothetical protein
MVTVEDRTAETLLSIIQKYILPDTTIISDIHPLFTWATYRQIGELPEGYTTFDCKTLGKFHGSVATTNHVESEWQKFKMQNKKHYGTQNYFLNHIFQSIVGEFVCFVENTTYVLLMVSNC